MISWPFLIIALLAIAAAPASASIVTSIVDDKPLDPLAGRICGIGDMNRDGNTDLIMQRREGGTNRLVVYLQQESGDWKNSTQTIDLGSGQEDVFCSVGDFNGDACPDLLVIQQIAEQLDIIDKLKAVFQSRKRKYQAKVYLNDQENNSFKEVLLCDKSNDPNGEECIANQFVDHPFLVDINGDGISDIMGFETKENSGADPSEATSLFCRAGIPQEDLHRFAFKPCEDKFPTPGLFHTGFTPIFTDLDGDLNAEIAFVDSGENNSVGGHDTKKLVVWKMDRLSYDRDDFRWVHSKELSIELPSSDKLFGSPLVADVDSDGLQEILVPICDNKECNSVSTLWCYKYSPDLRKAQWQNVTVDLGKSTLHPEVDGDTMVLFRIGDFSQNGYPDLIGTMSTGGGVPVPTILENQIDPTVSSVFRKFQLSQKPQRILKELKPVHLSAFFDLKEDGNLDMLYEYNGDTGPMVNFVKCDEKGDTTFLKVQIFTGDKCSSNKCCWTDEKETRTVKIGSGIAWLGACVSIKMADSVHNVIDQATRLSHQCQMPQSSHRILHGPFVLFGLSRSPNFVEEVHMGTPRPQQLTNSRWQQDMIRQVVPNSRVIVIPPDFSDRSGGWTSRLYVTPSRLIILSVLVMVSMCVFLLILIAALHLRERHEDKKERQAQTHRFHFDAM